MKYKCECFESSAILFPRMEWRTLFRSRHDSLPVTYRLLKGSAWTVAARKEMLDSHRNAQRALRTCSTFVTSQTSCVHSAKKSSQISDRHTCATTVTQVSCLYLEDTRTSQIDGVTLQIANVLHLCSSEQNLAPRDRERSAPRRQRRIFAVTRIVPAAHLHPIRIHAHEH